MAFAEHVRKRIMARDAYTCQAEDCIGYDQEGYPREFFLTGTLLQITGLIVQNGGFNLNASHHEKRDYNGKDYNMYNKDGSERGNALCVLCHARHEMTMNCDNAKLLLQNQSTRTFEWILNNGGEDYDLKVGEVDGLTIKEVNMINNNRRKILVEQLIRAGARHLV